jgi:hypothetical protein
LERGNKRPNDVKLGYEREKQRERKRESENDTRKGIILMKMK